MANETLNDAKVAKKDEFYTQYEDVEREMNAYIDWNPNVFRDKTVLLPCDDPEWSSFTRYFVKNFDRLGLKKLISTCYAGGLGGKTASDIERNSPLFNLGKSQSRGKLLVMERDVNGDASDRHGIEFRGYLQGNGDFRSPEVRKLRNEADFIITNPPFSLFREFFSWIQKGKKQFIILGNMNAITYKDIFPLLKDNKAWLGNGFNKTMEFQVPDGYAYDEKITNEKNDGHRYGKVPSIAWFTNVDHFKHHQVLVYNTMQENLQNGSKLNKKLKKEYGICKYPKYDNYDAIEVPSVDAIPSDYAGVMGVPITYLDRHNPDHFEIIWQASGNAYANAPREILEELKFDPTIKYGGGLGAAVVNGQAKYSRILIRNKHPKPCSVPLADVIYDPAVDGPFPDPVADASKSISASAPAPSGPKEVPLDTLMKHAGLSPAPQPAPDDEEDSSPRP